MIRGGQIGRRILVITAWLLSGSALVAVLFERWESAVVLGVVAAGCVAALAWDRLVGSGSDEGPNVGSSDEGR